MLLALFTAPLFHLHERDDHGHHDASLVHAHLLELEESHHHHDVDEIDASDTHGNVRWVEYFTFTVAPASFDLPVDSAPTLSVPVLEERWSAVMPDLPPAHGPPAQSPSVPRSPPSI
jgi:hypothetical protein